MSYILDALQKSTAEGNPVVAASLLRGNAKQRKQKLIGGLIVMALFANVVLFTWRFSSEREDPAQAVQPTPTITTDAAIEAPEQSARQRLPLLPADEENPAPLEAPPLADGSRDIALEPLKTITVADLPEPARLAFPELEFSTHIYAEDRTLRAIVVNGQRLEEGDSFEGLGLLEITPEGVIFRFQDYLIAVSVLALWEVGA
ncbi:MAG: general secretion pathway protein GspB [Gammaproteobacteria bacterium]|nr:general secretion pathway protein GspB [Gammaproteobacteria bacterium]